MTARCDDATVLARFLADQGLSAARRTPLTGDASTRRYQRLHPAGRRSLILMQAPHPTAELLPFIEIAGLLAPLGLSVPAIIAADAEAGLLLLEDFGDATFSGALDRGADPEPLYRLATDVLITLHRGFRDTIGPLYDAEAFVAQVMLLPELVFPMKSSVYSDFETAWRAVMPAALGGPTTLLLRDYHAGNLMHLPERPGVRACGLLDFQDAGIGPAAYDVISLVEDARRDLPPGLANAMIEHYLSAFSDLDRVAFRRAGTVLAAIRHTRVIAVFLRLARRGKPGYLPYLPRVWRLLDRHLAEPALAPVARWFERHLPADQRPRLPVTEPKS